MKKILLILTGGTIGSESKNGILGLKKEGSVLLDLYLSNGRKDVDFEVLRLTEMLSENAMVGDISSIINTINGVNTDLYSGIIVAYGTDTLGYAATLAAMGLYAYPIPVVFAAADKPLEEKDSNGIINFSGAIDFVLDTGINGIYVCYKNPEDSIKIHLASRILQAEVVTGNFISVANAYFGTMEKGKFIINSSSLNPKLSQIAKKKGENLPLLGNSPKLLYIKPCPATDFRVYDLEKIAPDAAVVELYHSGTGRAEGEGSLAEFIKDCASRGIPAVLASYPYIDNRKYMTTKTLEQEGGIFAYRMSAEAALAKTLVYFMGKKELSLDKFMAKDLFFEILD